MFSKNTERKSREFGLCLDFSKAKHQISTASLFSENELVGMLQVPDYDSADQVSSILGSIIDMMCRNMDTAEVTTVFTEYIELIRFIYREDTVSYWNSSELRAIHEKI